MRTRFGIFFMYLILACILSENALPYFADSQAMECFEQKKECSEKEEKKGREVEDEWKALKEKNHLRFFRLTSYPTRSCQIFAESDNIPDSAIQAIFSPPPERA